jgi:uncharacterized damage-inducible protein DinB
MTSSEVLVDSFERIRDAVYPAVNDLSVEDLTFRPNGGTNSISWLVWHLTRIQDDHVAGLRADEQVWTTEGWYERFALPFDPFDTGYGHGPEDVSEVAADASLLLGYFEAVHERTIRYVRTLSESDLEEVIDRSWNPPVTRGVRLVSVIADDLQHVGQAAYVRGLIQGSGA